jgi:hypothetical protein
MTSRAPTQDEMDEREAARRRDEAISRPRNAPPKPNRNYIGQSAPPPRREPKGSNRKGR